MIGVVVVAHSRALADAAVALARQMVPADSPLRVAIAAGAGDGGFGTDATAVSAAIEEVDGPGGVLVLLDLGSAVLSAELALELLPAETSGRVRLSAAPLVEGLVAALVLAATGADQETVAAEAERGLAAKQAHLGGDPADPASPGAGQRRHLGRGAGHGSARAARPPRGPPGGAGRPLRRIPLGREPRCRHRAGRRPQLERRCHPGRSLRSPAAGCRDRPSGGNGPAGGPAAGRGRFS